MPDDQHFLHAIALHPADAEQPAGELRLVYADWLEEQGRDAEADYLRLEVQLYDSDLERDQVVELKEELRSKVEDGWRSQVTLQVVENCVVQDADDGLFDFECPLQWTALNETEQGNVRFCDACKQHVHLCESMSEALWFARQGACVAIDICSKPSKVQSVPKPGDEPANPLSNRRMGRIQVNSLTRKRLNQLRKFPSQQVKRRNS